MKWLTTTVVMLWLAFMILAAVLLVLNHRSAGGAIIGILT